MNIVDYAIAFQDRASAPLNSFVARMQRSMPVATRFGQKITEMTFLHGRSYNELQKRMREVENIIRNSTIKSEIRAAKRELADLQRQANKRGVTPSLKSGGGTGFSVAGMVKGGLVVGAIMGIGRMAGSFFGGAFKAGIERQKIQTSFDVLAGDKTKGSALTTQLVELQKNTILGKEVFKNAQTMMGFGFDSSDVVKNMRMLGDVSMGNVDSFNSLTLAYSQIRAAGKLQGQDLLQLVTAGFNPLETMAKRTGKSIGVLRDEMSKGNISFKDVQQAFIDATSEGGRFNNMLGKIAETPAGKLQQLSGRWGEFKVAAGAALSPLITKALDIANKIMPAIEKMLPPLSAGVEMIVSLFDKIKPYYIEVFTPAIQFFKGLLKDTKGWLDYLDVVKELFVSHIFPVVSKLWRVIFNIAGKIVDFVKNSNLLKDVFAFIGKIVGGIFDMIGALVDAVQWVFDKIILPIYKAIDKVYTFFRGGKGQQPANNKPSPKLSPKPIGNDSPTNILKDIRKNTADNISAAATVDKSVASGGNKTINIVVQKMFDDLNITTNNITEGLSEVEQKVYEVLARVLTNGAITAL